MNINPGNILHWTGLEAILRRARLNIASYSIFVEFFLRSSVGIKKKVFEPRIERFETSGLVYKIGLKRCNWISPRRNSVENVFDMVDAWS